MRVKKGDTIKIISGKDKNKTGKVLKVFPKRSKVLIEGLNLYKKHVKPKREGEKGETVLVPRPIDVSNILLICGACGKAVKSGSRFDGKTKIRICKKCGATI
jgi:large subunit ribosomal protein L24